MVDYASVLVDLKVRRGTLAEETRELDALIEGVERMVSRFSRSPMQARLIEEPSKVIHARQSPPKQSMPETIKAHFEALPAAAWQTTRQVQDAVASQGIKVGKNLRGHVYNTLHRLSQEGGIFQRTREGRWGLRAWGSGVGETSANGS